MDLSGILLAGGKSKRFGPNKIKIMYNGIPLIVDQIIKLCFFCNEIIISSSRENQDFIRNTLEKFKDYSRILKIPEVMHVPPIKIVLDENIKIENTTSIGPLAGIYSGLRKSGNDKCLIIASDMPFISYRLLKLLADTIEESPEADSVIVKNNKGIEALCGIYSKNYIKIIEESIKKGIYKISKVLDSLEVKWIDSKRLREERIDIYNFFNINSRKDIKKFVQIYNKGVNGYGTDHFSSGSGKKWEDNFYRRAGKGVKEKEL
jgi:molybdenum cofactor guanylyltransferase